MRPHIVQIYGAILKKRLKKKDLAAKYRRFFAIFAATKTLILHY